MGTPEPGTGDGLVGSIEIRFNADGDDNIVKGPYAYYVESVKGEDGRYTKKKTYIGKVPNWYINLFSKDQITEAKGQRK